MGSFSSKAIDEILRILVPVLADHTSLDKQGSLSVPRTQHVQRSGVYRHVLNIPGGPKSSDGFSIAIPRWVRDPHPHPLKASGARVRLCVLLPKRLWCGTTSPTSHVRASIGLRVDGETEPTYVSLFKASG